MHSILITKLALALHVIFCVFSGKKKTQDLILNPIRHRAQDHRINVGGGGAVLGTHSHSYFKAYKDIFIFKYLAVT